MRRVIGNRNVLKSGTAAPRKAARNPENGWTIAKVRAFVPPSGGQLPMPNFNWLTKPIKSHDSRLATIVHSLQGHVILGAMPISIRDWCGVADAVRVLKVWHYHLLDNNTHRHNNRLSLSQTNLDFEWWNEGALVSAGKLHSGRDSKSLTWQIADSIPGYICMRTFPLALSFHQWALRLVEN